MRLELTFLSGYLQNLTRAHSPLGVIPEKARGKPLTARRMRRFITGDTERPYKLKKEEAFSKSSSFFVTYVDYF